MKQIRISRESSTFLVSSHQFFGLESGSTAVKVLKSEGFCCKVGLAQMFAKAM